MSHGMSGWLIATLAPDCGHHGLGAQEVLSLGPDAVPGLLGIVLDAQRDENIEDPGFQRTAALAAELAVQIGGSTGIPTLTDVLLRGETTVDLDERLWGVVLHHPEEAFRATVARKDWSDVFQPRLGDLLGELAARGFLDPRGFEFLLSLLDTHPEVAAAGLADYGDQMALPALRRALGRALGEGRPDLPTAHELLDAMEVISGELGPIERELLVWVTRPTRQERRMAKQLKALLEAQRALEALEAN